MAARAPEQVRRLLVGSGAWPPAQRAAAAPGSPSCIRVRGTLMIMDAGPSPAHLGWHTVCGLAQGARRRPSWGGGRDGRGPGGSGLCPGLGRVLTLGVRWIPRVSWTHWYQR